MATVLEPSVARGPAPESSDRSFGFVFAGVFALIGCWPVVRLLPPRWWMLGIAVAFALAALVWPQILHPFNRTWLALGRLLHRVVSPLLMGVIFFVVVTPIAWIMRLRGKDVLSLARRTDLSSYWITREPQAPASETMKRQF
jgi:Saxitoxin biosynthesis operon protein SxtJ